MSTLFTVTVELWIDGAWTDVTGDTYVRDRITITRGRRDERARATPSRLTITFNNRDGRYSVRNPASPLYGKIGRNTPIRVSVDGDIRFVGEVAAWPTAWDRSGADVSVSVEAAGIMRRLGQGASPIASALRRGVTGDASGVVGYWPCEDPAGSTTLASGIGGQAMRITGSPNLATYDAFDASEAIPTVAGSTWTGRTSSHTRTGNVQVRFLAGVPDGGIDVGATIAAIYCTGTARRWELYSSSGSNLGLRAYDGGGTQLFDSGGVAFNVAGKDLLIGVELAEDAGDVDWKILSLEPGKTIGLQFGGTLAGHTVDSASTVVVSPAGGLTDVAIGHVVVQNEITALFELGAQLGGWVGERAAARIQRLCGDEGITVSIVGDGDDTVPLGAQRSGTLLDLLHEAADADGGILYETRDALGLTYRTRGSLYNQAPALELDYSAAQIRDITPVEDDQAIRNDITVHRARGSAARAVAESGPLSIAAPPDGVGRYDDEITVNVEHDDQLVDQAHWRLHLGTVDQARYPTIGLQLAAPAYTSDPQLTAAVRGLDLGDRFTVTGLPSWLPPEDISQLVQGYTETVGLYRHDIEINSTPEQPWRVGVWGDDTPLAVVDAAASEADPSATTLTLSVPAGVADGHLMIAVLKRINDSGPTDVPTGWTLIDEADIAAGWMGAYWRIAESEPASYTWTFGNFARGRGDIIAVAGHDPVDPIAAYRLTSSGTNTDTYAADPITIDSCGGLLISTIGARVPAPSSQTWTIDAAGDVEHTDQTTANASGSAASMATCDSAGLLLAGTYARTFTAVETCQHAQISLIAVRPAVSPVSPVRYDTAGSELAASVDSDDTSLSVATTAGPVWTTDTAYLPFDIKLGGEQMTVTAISGTSSPQTFTVIRGVNGVATSHAAGDEVRLHAPAVRALSIAASDFVGDLAAGELIYSRDFPASGYASDDTQQLNLTNDGWETGTPEVSVTFTAPTSGRVTITVGGGLRDNGATDDRVFLSVRVVSRHGTEILAPAVTETGFGSINVASEFHYGSRTFVLDTGLVPGDVYTATVMHIVAPSGASPAGTADINFRDITIEPLP